MCGEPAGEPYSFGYKGRIRYSLLSVGGGVLAFAALGIIQAARNIPGTPVGRWVLAWYDHPVRHRRGRYGYGYYTSPLGTDISFYLGAAGIGLIVLGVLIFVKHQFSSPVWAEDSGGSWWGSRRWWM